jgi:hypothetical protein
VFARRKTISRTGIILLSILIMIVKNKNKILSRTISATMIQFVNVKLSVSAICKTGKTIQIINRIRSII